VIHSHILPFQTEFLGQTGVDVVLDEPPVVEPPMLVLVVTVVVDELDPVEVLVPVTPGPVMTVVVVVATATHPV
jgi:hypothetical protein